MPRSTNIQTPKNPSSILTSPNPNCPYSKANKQLTMSSSHDFSQDPQHEGGEEEEEEEDAMFDPADAAEEIVDEDGDAAMDSGSENEGEGEDEIMQELQLINDSSENFDDHKVSIFSIA